MPIVKCDRCDCQIDLDNDPAICFNSSERTALSISLVVPANEKVYLCEPCVEEVKREFIDEIRETNIIESDT